MPFFLALRLILVAENGFSPVRFLHSCCGNEEIASRLLAAAQSALICLEELFSEVKPIISFLFPAYLPLVSAFIFACFNVPHRIFTLRNDRG
jgi:hypothetical protein